jgi:nitrogen fixation protein NifU and related proteins
MNNDAGAATELRDLYRELILDHARSPRHFGKLEGATHSADGINPLCGDKLKLYFRLDGDMKIADARFEGSGCAISVASASLLTESVTGMSVAEATDFFHMVTASLSGKTATTTIDLGKLRALQGVKEFPARVKCATLAWHAMNAALNRDRNPATTE